MSHRSISRTVRALAAMTLLAAPAQAAQYYFTVDVPTTLGSVTYTPSQIVRATGSGYVVEAELPEGLELSALVRTPEGFWLMTPAVPVPGESGEPSIETRDVVLFDPATESLLFALDGSAAGIPEYATIDALLYDRASDRIVLSFDVPVTLAGTTYAPSDLVAYGAGFSLFWSAAAGGVPSYANVVAADQDQAGRLVIAFDVPVALGAVTYLPGQLVQWTTGGGFALYASDPGWPAGSAFANVGFLPASGEVPDGVGGDTPLTITPAAGGQITLSWGSSCAITDSDYAVYEGAIGAPFANHVPITCSTGGATSWTFSPGAGNRYYYVVPRNAVTEGSYGQTSGGAPRPASPAACVPQEALSSCH